MLRIEYERKRVGLSQAALGREAGIHPTTISQIESGRINPSEKELERITDVLRFEGEGRLLTDEVRLNEAQSR